MAAKETTVQTVTMADGKIVDFAGKKKMLKTAVFNEDGSIAIRLDFVNGEFRLFTLPTSLVSKFAAHGAEQKLGDEIAGLDDVADCVIAVDTLIDRLYEGKWNATRESSGMAGTSILARALVEQSGKPIAVVRAFLATKTHGEKTALRNNASIRPIIDRLESEKASNSKKVNKVDTDSLLDSLTAETFSATAPANDAAEAAPDAEAA